MSTVQATRPTLRFLGAAGTVTGSKFLVETASARVLVDCGLFQGDRAWRRRNWDDLPVDPGTVDAVVLTHAHLDHSGALPLLTRHGFSGPVFCTPATARLAAIVLRDAAHLQEEDARYANEAGFSKHSPALPLFDTADAEKAISLLRPLEHDERGTLPGGMTLHLRRAGHILGSAFAELDVDGSPRPVLRRHGPRRAPAAAAPGRRRRTPTSWWSSRPTATASTRTPVTATSRTSSGVRRTAAACACCPRSRSTAPRSC